MVEKRESSSGANLSMKNLENDIQHMEAKARMREMAKEIGVDLSLSATFDEIQNALFQEEGFLTEQIQSANSAYEEYFRN